MSKVEIVAAVFILLVLAYELWHLAMMFYRSKQVRGILIYYWYQWSIHRGRLSLKKRLEILDSLIRLYEKYGVEDVLPGFNLLVQKEILALMFDDRKMNVDDLVRITDRLFCRISKIWNSEGAVEAEVA